MLTHFSHHQLVKGLGPQLLTDSTKTSTGMNYKMLSHKPPARHFRVSALFMKE